MNYWLMKSEPNAFSIDDLEQMPDQTIDVLSMGMSSWPS